MYTVYINQDSYQVEQDMSLLTYLRDTLRLTSLKNGCGEGACGTCTVLVDGRAMRACLLTVAKVSGKQVLTVEGLSNRERDLCLGFCSGRSGAVRFLHSWYGYER